MNQINITIPDGMEIDKEKSSLEKGIIIFKPRNKNIFEKEIIGISFKESINWNGHISVTTCSYKDITTGERKDLYLKSFVVSDQCEVILHKTRDDKTIIEIVKK